MSIVPRPLIAQNIHLFSHSVATTPIPSVVTTTSWTLPHAPVPYSFAQLTKTLPGGKPPASPIVVHPPP
ncbi:hypothetical protein IDZ49_09930 [Francisella tularensis]|nr:hypothetical protein [Francisella tularensis]